MDLLEQTKLLDRLSYSLGHIKGVADMLKTTHRKDLDKQKLLEVLEVIAYNLEQSIKTLLKDEPQEEM